MFVVIIKLSISVISNKLEGHTLSSIIAALDQYIVPEGIQEFVYIHYSSVVMCCLAGLLTFAYNVLSVLPAVPRFGVIKMFLSTEDTRGTCYCML